MGVANRLASPLVRRVYLAFPIHGEDARYVVTGRPVESRSVRSAAVGSHQEVVVVGGSLGAARLNDAATAAWAHSDPGFHVMHVTGEREYARFQGLSSTWYQVHDYIPNLMATLLGVGPKLIVSRAGGFVFEIATAGCPSILVPSPNVTARHLERAGAAIVIADADLTPELLDSTARTLLADPERLQEMAEAARRWARPEAAARIADDLLTLAR